MNTIDLFSYEHCIIGDKIKAAAYPWEILPILKQIILDVGRGLSADEYDEIAENVWISKSATVAKSAYISGPCIICEGAEVRHCAYIRGSVVVGKYSVVGNSTEVKNSILFDKVQVPHYNYIGDSILGYGAHFGAGALTSNVKGDKTCVKVVLGGERIETGLKKLGALVGDNAEIGCQTVLNPGCIVGKNTQIYPQSSVRGSIENNMIYKSSDNIIIKSDKH